MGKPFNQYQIGVRSGPRPIVFLNNGHSIQSLIFDHHLMFNFLKKTWRQEEVTSQSLLPTPSAEDTESVLAQTPNPPSVDIPTSKSGSKRSRQEFEPEPQSSPAERPSKAAKTWTHDSIRNHLPEIVDSRQRDDAVVHLSLSVLKEQISETAKLQNSKFSLYGEINKLIWIS